MTRHFSGNHKKSTTFIMPREPHRCGVKGSRSSKDEKIKRGILQEQVCVFCPINRAGNIMTELICKGRMKHTDLESSLQVGLRMNLSFVLIHTRVYIRFAQNLEVELQQINFGSIKKVYTTFSI